MLRRAAEHNSQIDQQSNLPSLTLSTKVGKHQAQNSDLKRKAYNAVINVTHKERCSSLPRLGERQS